jgi:opacity protein-like surface antigen
MRCLTRMWFAAILCAALAAPALFTTAAHADGATLSGIDAMTSTVMQEGQSSFSGIALRVRLKSPRFIEGIEFMPTVEYWRNTSSIQAFGGIKTTRKDATLGADARYMFRSTGIRPYLGAGFALHFLSSAVDAPSLGINDQSDALVKGGLAALAGASFALSERFDNFVELKYHHVTQYRQLKLNWGLTYKL